MKGADAEAGYHFGKSRLLDFYAAAGPYYYLGEMGTSTLGGKARVAGTYDDYITLEISDSYDSVFHNNLQCQITFTLPFGSPPKPATKCQRQPRCKSAVLASRMIQDVSREEIIVERNETFKLLAISPFTNAPYFVVFVNNTSSSNGTYESPYHTLAQAQSNSSPYDIIYVFPGDGTTTGMNAGITLQANQKFWGSGTSHSLQTTKGTVLLPVQTSTSPSITNTDAGTDGNAITLATNNAISGFTIGSALNDGIYGTNPHDLEVLSCTFQSTTTFPIEATFSTGTTVTIKNNTLLNNVNGISLTLNGTSTVVCSDNTFSGQTSVSNVPIEISANSNTLTTQIENNTFSSNTTGSIRFNLNNVVDANITIPNNTFTSNGTGAQASLGSNIVFLQTGTTSNCTLSLTDNTFTSNTSNSLYMHTSGTFTVLDVTASTNTMTNNGGSGLVLATPVANTLTLLATGNAITGSSDNGIAVIASATTTTGTLTLNNNTIKNITNSSNGIAVNQDFSTLNLTLSNNTIDNCEGTGIISYAPTGISSFTLTAGSNTISNCQNLSSNASSGLDIEQYTTLGGSVTNNTFSGNTGTALVIGSTLTAPTICISLSGNNSSTGYLLNNPVDGLFRLTPCNATSVNVGTINTSGTIDMVQSCTSLHSCAP